MRQHPATFSAVLVVAAACAALGAAGCAGPTDASSLQAPSPPQAVAGEKTPTPAAGPPAPAVVLSAPKAAEEAPISRFIGTYEYVGGMPEQRVVWGKIEAMANTFNIFARGIVRDKLAASNQIAKTIRIEADSETLVIYFDKTNQSAPLDGTSVKHKAINGEKMDMSFRVEPSLIEQTFKGNAKSRVNSYQLKDGKLILHTSIKAAQLPRELAYDLTYQRTDAVGDKPAAAAEAQAQP